ncbi:UDP-N-acetylglucosamine 2-epimerase (non-hydrolyzing) [Massilia sp. H-1]|nr:UDP-N-acetylglucosamine 2-epimerase (non-hydrolyzing) [Massilia sp. H-1]
MTVTQIKIVTIVGARPQFVKAAVVSRALAAYPGIEEVLVHTGQHFDANMSDVFFTEMAIPAPRYNMHIGGGSHGENTGRMIEQLEKNPRRRTTGRGAVVQRHRLDLGLAALAAAKLVIPLVHIESGLRSFRRGMPEEINRIVTDRLADVLYTPSPVAVANLMQEGVASERVRNTGDVMYDAVLLFKDIARTRSTILATLGLRQDGYALLTLHRKENTDDPRALADIFAALGSCGRAIVFPVHPRTRKRIAEQQVAIPANVTVIDPLGYLDTLALLQGAALLLTDSGGMQKEAYFLDRPCITLRDEDRMGGARSLQVPTS